MTKIGFLGLGIMGAPMARNLIRAGHEVVLWTHTPGKAQVVGEGCTEVGDTPAQVARLCDCVFICVGDSEMSQQVIFGEQGLADGARSGMTIVDCSTISPSRSRRIADRLSKVGVEYLDAPCTGSRAGAEGATLTFMIGGDERVFTKVKPYLEAMGKQFYYCGSHGMGLHVKLSQNLIIGNLMQALNESLILSVRAGVAPQLMLDVIENSAARSALVSAKAPNILRRCFDTNFSVKWLEKDMRLMLCSAEEMNISLPLTRASQQRYRWAIEEGYGEEDICGSIRVLEKEAGCVVGERQAAAPAAESSGAAVVVGPLDDTDSEILNDNALKFLADLARRFEPERRRLLDARVERGSALRNGLRYQFLQETEEIRKKEWKVAPIPEDLLDRRIEITGPVDRKMVINALNSGANVFMADFEDSSAPFWRNMLDGQRNLRDAVRRTITWRSPEGKEYRLNDKTATLFVRPRGWHLGERHLQVAGEPISASLFDFGLYFFHNALELIRRGTGPYFYLPKLESHLEARLWNGVFLFAQEYLNIPPGSIRATVLIETLPAAFEMDEILFELREHSAGLNCGRWDYIFSFIKKFSHRRDLVFPDRSSLTMDKTFLKAYVDLLIQTCHRRGIHAMGGMAAQIPIRRDAAANHLALDKVRQDKLREVRAGHDGTWVAHPALVPVARAAFDEHMHEANQIGRAQSPATIEPGDLLAVPEGSVTRRGVEINIDIALQYLASWLRGTGCVPIYDLMEDAATAEISRSQLWQWVRNEARLEDGSTVTASLVESVLSDILARIRNEMAEGAYESSRNEAAGRLLLQLVMATQFPDFLTNAAYASID
jgi:malate synthase